MKRAAQRLAESLIRTSNVAAAQSSRASEWSLPGLAITANSTACSRRLLSAATSPPTVLRAFVRGLRGSSAAAEEASTSAASTSAPGTNPLLQTPGPPGSGPGLPTPVGRMGPQTAHATLNNIPISPKKLNDFAMVIRSMHLEDALIQCKVHTKKAARIIRKVLLSARANAVTNHGLDGDRLRVGEAWVGKGRHLKRVAIHGKGKAGQKLKYRSNFTVVLKEEAAKRVMRFRPMLMERRKSLAIREGGPKPPVKRYRGHARYLRRMQDAAGIGTRSAARA